MGHAGRRASVDRRPAFQASPCGVTARAGARSLRCRPHQFTNSSGQFLGSGQINGVTPPAAINFLGSRADPPYPREVGSRGGAVTRSRQHAATPGGSGAGGRVGLRMPTAATIPPARNNAPVTAATRRKLLWLTGPAAITPMNATAISPARRETALLIADAM